MFFPPIRLHYIFFKLRRWRKKPIDALSLMMVDSVAMGPSTLCVARDQSCLHLCLRCFLCGTGCEQFLLQLKRPLGADGNYPVASRYMAMLNSAPDFDYTFTKVIIAISVLYSFIVWRYCTYYLQETNMVDAVGRDSLRALKNRTEWLLGPRHENYSGHLLHWAFVPNSNRFSTLYASGEPPKCFNPSGVLNRGAFCVMAGLDRT